MWWEIWSLDHSETEVFWSGFTNCWISKHLLDKQPTCKFLVCFFPLNIDLLTEFHVLTTSDRKTKIKLISFVERKRLWICMDIHVDYWTIHLWLLFFLWFFWCYTCNKEINHNFFCNLPFKWWTGHNKSRKLTLVSLLKWWKGRAAFSWRKCLISRAVPGYSLLME